MRKIKLLALSGILLAQVNIAEAAVATNLENASITLKPTNCRMIRSNRFCTAAARGITDSPAPVNFTVNGSNCKEGIDIYYKLTVKNYSTTFTYAAVNSSIKVSIPQNTNLAPGLYDLHVYYKSCPNDVKLIFS